MSCEQCKGAKAVYEADEGYYNFYDHTMPMVTLFRNGKKLKIIDCDNCTPGKYKETKSLVYGGTAALWAANRILNKDGVTFQEIEIVVARLSTYDRTVAISTASARKGLPGLPSEIIKERSWIGEGEDFVETLKRLHDHKMQAMGVPKHILKEKKLKIGSKQQYQKLIKKAI